MVTRHPRNVRASNARRWPAAGTRRAALLLAVAAALTGGCAAVPDAQTRQIAADASRILHMDPNAVWTDCFNRLVAHGPASIHYLMARPEMQRAAAPDDLRVLLVNSLVRRLANPATAPDLSATALETTLGLLHLDLKVAAGTLGPVALSTRWPPRSWLDLFPAAFDHARAADADVEADRQALVAWYAHHRDAPSTLATPHTLRPSTAHLWNVLGRQYADRWGYAPEEYAVLCASPPGFDALLIESPSYDYNLVRAACIWLGSAADEQIQAALVELVSHPLATVSHNARFALLYSPDARIREVVRQFNASGRELRGESTERARAKRAQLAPAESDRAPVGRSRASM